MIIILQRPYLNYSCGRIDTCNFYYLLVFLLVIGFMNNISFTLNIIDSWIAIFV